MRCVICGHKFTKDDTGYVKGSISGEVLELLPSGPKATGQVLRHENVLMCLSHFESVPHNISENLRMNAQERAKQ
jgi:hypothetical protein